MGGETTSLIRTVGSVFGILAPIVLAVVGFLIRSWIAEARRYAEERERRVIEKLTKTDADILRVEKAHHAEAAAVSRMFNELPERFVPRKELEAIIGRIEYSSETTLTYLRKMDGQVDRLTQLILTGKMED